ncbi:uncharacterized protein si:dkeyp-77h1.4 [Periophthalmus magnuspinnatus]|uniref:uncharacterized protein si:dkeyp-77h1.4 n=1 Tax=Periophthalmus magnuspinnatus TaxID=409849 RepID=UPI002436F865|nr:uncharacterized protein si:dkeyp-77h1.4 [Periophthalmus magnuspinnatus]
MLPNPTTSEETETLFYGEDFHILLRSLNVEVTFRNRTAPHSQTSDEPLMRGGKSVSERAQLNSRLSHLIIESVSEADEGVYTVKDPANPEGARRISLIVRDCSNEQTVKYGDNYHIPLDLPPPSPPPGITLEYRPLSLEATQTSKPALVLLAASGTPREEYKDRIIVGEKTLTLRTVTGADEGSYTIRGPKGEIKTKMCLNVREHMHFLELPQGKRMKINLILNSTLVQVNYTRSSDPAPRRQYVLLDRGEFTDAQAELGFEGRLSLDGNVFYLDNIRGSDAGEFKVIDILGFPSTTVHLELKPFKLEKLYVAIIALLGFVVFLLLACLVSCLFKVRKRAKRNAALEKLAKEDEGEAFRQVVKNITKMSEESKHSQADNTEKSQSTEVDIKGLEVSSKEVGVGNLETSDSGVGFNTALPLDTDTDAADQLPDSEAASITEPRPSATSSATAKAHPPPSAPSTAEIKPPAPAPETKTSPQPKRAPEPPVEAKLEPPKSPEVKLSPAPSPEPKAHLSPIDPKSSPAAKSPSPTAEKKTTLAPTPEKSKPTTPEPITNGTAEIDHKASPDHADVIGGTKTVAPKTPEVELKSSGAEVDSSKDAPVAAESATTTSI